jgi:hypothetical protein
VFFNSVLFLDYFPSLQLPSDSECVYRSLLMSSSANPSKRNHGYQLTTWKCYLQIGTNFKIKYIFCDTLRDKLHLIEKEASTNHGRWPALLERRPLHKCESHSFVKFDTQ